MLYHNIIILLSTLHAALSVDTFGGGKSINFRGRGLRRDTKRIDLNDFSMSMQNNEDGSKSPSDLAALEENSFFDKLTGAALGSSVPGSNAPPTPKPVATESHSGPQNMLTIIGHQLPPGSYGACEGDCDTDDDCKGDLVCHQRDTFEEIPGCIGVGERGSDYCRHVDASSTAGANPTDVWPTYSPTDSPTPWSSYSPTTSYPTFSPANSTDFEQTTGEVTTFRRGDLTVKNRRLGIKLCTGMSVKVIARANEKVKLMDGGTSDVPFHSMADGAAIFPVANGYVYVSNSEMKERRGGVYGMYFDHDGNVLDYKQLLSGTTRNCGGGRTPWSSWISCEEFANGQCWQVDPEDKIPPQVTKLGGLGGNYESVAVDNRNPKQPIFYVTEDAAYGALRKYIPPLQATANWDTIHVGGGSTEYLRFRRNNEFEWTTDEDAARQSQYDYYRNVEGIDFHDGLLYFVSKHEYLLYVLDLDKGTYTTSSTEWGIMAGGGEFEYSPDQLVRNGEEYLYFTEDSGYSVGVYSIHIPSGKRHAIFEAYAQKYYWDETTGLAFNPDGTKFYAAFQDCGCMDSDSGVDYNCGCLMEFSRDDGQSFDGSTMALKYHSS